MNESQTTQPDRHGLAHVFDPGGRYQVIADCDISLERVYPFRIGEVVTFLQDYYSHYDSLSVYLFRTASGEERYWALHDTEPVNKWQQYFQRADVPRP
jgi:hypothetical protein